MATFKATILKLESAEIRGLQMTNKPVRTIPKGAGGQTNGHRIDYAKQSIEEMAANAIRTQLTGTIAVEISVKDGKLGKVKRLQIDFQSE